jgi:hypothetical protein
MVGPHKMGKKTKKTSKQGLFGERSPVLYYRVLGGAEISASGTILKQRRGLLTSGTLCITFCEGFSPFSALFTLILVT